MFEDRGQTYDWIVKTARMLLRLYFRTVEVDGAEDLPASGGGILVSWHPNGMIDPGLIFAEFPGTVVFGARHGLFKVPLLGQIMKAVGTVPIYRAMDTRDLEPEARRAANSESLGALAQEIAAGRFSCLFPEGDSHDRPELQQVKTGAARFWYQARALQEPGSPPPVIIPVGLHYDDKALFRSSALVRFHPPIEIPPELDVTPDPDEPEELTRERFRALSGLIEHTLDNVVYGTASWEIHFLLHRARQIIQTETAARQGKQAHHQSMEERTLRFAQLRTAWYIALESHHDEALQLMDRLREYDKDLRVLGVEDRDLDRDPKLVSSWLVFIIVLQLLLTFFLLPPILLAGLVVNLPVVVALSLFTRFGAKRVKDVASIKLMVGALLFPLTWIAAGIVAALAVEPLNDYFPRLPNEPLLASAVVVILGIFGGAIGARYVRLAKETVRAARVRLRRRAQSYTVERLKGERREIFDAMFSLAFRLELP